MKAVILAAGTASRLRPLTDNMPKCLLKIGGHCLLGRTIDTLSLCGIDDFLIVTGYLSSQIVDFVNINYPDLKVQFVHNKDYETTNNIYSLWLVRDKVINEPILLLDSDILFDFRVAKSVINSPHENALALNRHDLGEEEIKVIANNRGEIVEISKTCSIEMAAGESVGIEKMSCSYTSALFEELSAMVMKENLKTVFYEQAFERLVSKGYLFSMVDTTQYFSVELDTVDDFMQAQKNIPHNLFYL